MLGASRESKGDCSKHPMTGPLPASSTGFSLIFIFSHYSLWVFFLHSGCCFIFLLYLNPLVCLHTFFLVIQIACRHRLSTTPSMVIKMDKHEAPTTCSVMNGINFLHNQSSANKLKVYKKRSLGKINNPKNML
ncbi:Uncharacterised protein [Fluoribacter dumoffii]|uniref:Uncharacterized protein n=1 Tax=Fluoribacter dumoffii TaxID=463 RepID=A0A377G725_9GAMM|nr:hypothetical protein Ldum_0492 [Fluoribacter dumoffii NY 23]STO20533.1 Uncharacterised protein [Fluoribacter dumoffii]